MKLFENRKITGNLKTEIWLKTDLLRVVDH